VSKRYRATINGREIEAVPGWSVSDDETCCPQIQFLTPDGADEWRGGEFFYAAEDATAYAVATLESLGFVESED